MEEMESRCKNLEQNICDMLEANIQCQTEEVRLRETTVNMVNESEYAKMADKLLHTQNSLVSNTFVLILMKSCFFFIISAIFTDK